jgi:hypothetical protein
VCYFPLSVILPEKARVHPQPLAAREAEPRGLSDIAFLTRPKRHGQMRAANSGKPEAYSLKVLRVTSIDDSVTVVGCGGSSVHGNTFSKR